MGVIDLDARVKKLEQNAGGAVDPAVIVQLEADVTDLKEAAVPERTTVTTLDNGTIESGGGGVYYDVMGNLVHVHMAVSTLGQNTRKKVFALPTAIKPSTAVFGVGYATTDNSNKYPSYVIIKDDGDVDGLSPTGSVFADVFYLLIPSTPTP